MRKILIDINILIDMVSERDDYHSATAVFDLCAKRKIKGHICAHEVTTFMYLLGRQKTPLAVSAEILQGLLDTLTVIPAPEKIFRDALLSPIDDFEDAVIEVSCIKEEIDWIITRNKRDFNQGRVGCCSAGEFLALLSR